MLIADSLPGSLSDSTCTTSFSQNGMCNVQLTLARDPNFPLTGTIYSVKHIQLFDTDHKNTPFKKPLLTS